jgi:methylene-tetrahydrofolate reductase-like protein
MLSACPKRMRHGPCGGVRADLGCEMTPASECVFGDLGEPVSWTGPVAAPGSASMPPAPVVLTDFTVSPYSARSVADVAGALAGSCDGVLVGEHQNRPDFPPTLMTRLIREVGAVPWITLTCRDRNRVVLEQELLGLAVAGAAAVLCVTGDGRARDVRPGVTQVWDVDSTDLVSLAAGAGLPLVAVAEAPDAPPRALRPGRLLQKQRAGAQVCVLNHVGSSARVAGFAAAGRAAGVAIPLIASVAVYTDERSAAVLRLPGLHLDQAAVGAVLSAPDPVAAGIEAAVTEARALLAIDGVVGVNLSGLASGRDEVFAARVKAEVGRQVRA